MSLNVCTYSFDVYGNDLKILAERLRNNWMQKLSNHDEPDDSLTSLAWLYDMHPIGLDLEAPNHGTDMFSNNVAGKNLCQFLHIDYPKYLVNENQPFAGSLLDPQVRMDYRTKWTGKPPFSYATLICLAMRELGKPKVTLSDIYGWIMSNFAYYRHTDSSWQNSVRHNLSLNKCFEKVPRDKGERGKGGFWRVNPRHADWLEANLAKCRRAAPPPGPPPPMPRSMLLQQQQHHQYHQHQGMLHSNSLLTPSSMTVQNSITFTQCPTPSTSTYISEISWESSKFNRVPALSPSSASSHSSLSSSPLSFPSVGSPVALPNKLPQVTNGHTVSPSIAAIFRNQPILSEMSDANVSHFNLPAVQVGPHVSQNHHTQILVTHRRKSPLFHHPPDSDTQCPALESDEELDFDPQTQISKLGKQIPSIGPKKISNDLPRLSNRSVCLAKNSKSNLATQSWSNLKLKPYSRIGNPNSDKSQSNTKLDLGLPDSGLTGRCARIRRPNKSKSVKRTNSDCLDTRLMPTRILPPRRRYSRWALPKSKQDTDEIETSQYQSNSSCGPKSSDHSHEIYHSKIKHEPSPNRAPKFHSRSFRSAADDDDDVVVSEDDVDDVDRNDDDDDDDNEEDDDDGEDADYVWPPIERDPNTKARSKLLNSFGKSDFSNYHHHQTNDQPPQPNSKVMISTNPSLSSISLLTSLSDHSKTSVANELNRHHFNSNHIVPNPNFLISNQRDRSRSDAHGSVCFESTGFLPQSDKSTGFKWDSVFLSDDAQNRLDHLFEPDRSSTDALDLFGSMPDRDDMDPSTRSDQLLDFVTASDLSRSRPNSSQPTEHASGNLNEPGQTSEPMPNLSDSYQTNLSDSGSPLLDDLDLETSDLNFDSFDGLVESTGPIPLDIDFSLTASFSGSYSTSTTDMVMDSNDLNATIWSSGSCPSDKQTGSNSSYFTKSNDPGTDILGLNRSQPTDQMWFTDSQSLASSHSLAMLLNEASVHLFEDMTSDLSTNLQENLDSNRLTTPPLN